MAEQRAQETLLPASTSLAEESAVCESILDQVRDALRGLRFGQVTIIVQDGQVVQIDRLDRRRVLTNRRRS